jgi:predicted nucleic acid-binding protein
MRSRFHADLSSGAWSLIEFGADVFSKASDLMVSLTAPLATLDALHLACALQHGADQFATGDLQLATAARKSGLRVLIF